MDPKSEPAEQLASAIFDSSRDWLESYTRNPSIECHRIESSSLPMHQEFDQATYIVVFGKQISLLFAVGYRFDEIEPLARNCMAITDQRLASQFISEYANLVAGKTKQILERALVRAAISLPLTSVPLVDLDHVAEQSHQQSGNDWDLRYPGGSLRCKVRVRWQGAHVSFAMDSATATSAPPEESGAVEFL